MKRFPLLIVFCTALLCAAPACADVFIVVADASPLQVITTKALQALYMGRTRTADSGEVAQVYDLPRENDLRDMFYQSLTGMSPAQINSYWSRLIFTGQTLPPMVLPNEQAVQEVLKHNVNGIGYLSKEPKGTGLRTLLVLRSASAG